MDLNTMTRAQHAYQVLDIHPEDGSPVDPMNISIAGAVIARVCHPREHAVFCAGSPDRRYCQDSYDERPALDQLLALVILRAAVPNADAIMARAKANRPSAGPDASDETIAAIARDVATQVKISDWQRLTISVQQAEACARHRQQTLIPIGLQPLTVTC